MRLVAVLIVLFAIGVHDVNVRAQDKPADAPKAAQAADVDALNKRFDALEKQITTLVQQGQPSADATYAKLVASYRSYWEAAKKTSEYRACKASKGRPVPTVTAGSGSIVCERR